MASVVSFKECMHRRQAQIALSDLSTTATRESDAYMAQTDSRGRALPSNPFRDAQVAAQVQQRQAQPQASGNSATAAWNNSVADANDAAGPASPRV